MSNFTMICLGEIYEIERKALAKAVANGTENSFMRGIIEVISEIEGFMLDREAEKNDA